VSEAHVLISLEPRHAEAILAGTKRVELRRRSMRVEPGTTVWLYAKLPVGQIIGCARIRAAHIKEPSALWKAFATASGLSKGEFFDYFEGVRTGCAIALHEVEMLPRALGLASVRAVVGSFQPPQFFARLADGELLNLMKSARRDARRGCNR
jgi:predicted transcriptional regulator